MAKAVPDVVARGKLRNRVMDVLILLVLHFKRRNRQSIEEEDEVDLLVGLPEVEVRAEGDAVLAVLLDCGALSGSRLRVEEAELQTAHLQAVAQDHPERRVLQFLA